MVFEGRNTSESIAEMGMDEQEMQRYEHGQMVFMLH